MALTGGLSMVMTAVSSWRVNPTVSLISHTVYGPRALSVKLECMSLLTLVRHGQAPSFERDSPLTTLGESQARRLAEYWLLQGDVFDEVYSGTLMRQVGTEQIVS